MNLQEMIRADAPAVAAAVGALTTRASAPSADAAYEMGATGGPVVEAERVAFESWMSGHCWALCATWDGKAYRSDAEQGGEVDPRAVRTRQLWAAWRDRAALAVQPAPAAARLVADSPSPTDGMNIAQRILHVGGRNNEAGYIEFGSIQAIEALVGQVLRDVKRAAPQPLTDERITAEAFTGHGYAQGTVGSVMFRRGVRYAERAHGIGTQESQEGGAA